MARRPRPYRTKYQAKLKAPPESWSPDWLSKMDQRFRHLALVRGRLEMLEADLSAGDPESLSWIQRRLCNHLVWSDVMLEEIERRFVRGEEIDTGQFAGLLAVLVRLADKLGLKRKIRDATPRLRDIVAIEKGPPQ